MSELDARSRKESNAILALQNSLNQIGLLTENRLIDENQDTICPLCRKKISAGGFFEKVAQAEGREVHDLTVTEINLFHIEELRLGSYNHKTYNLGWGHHHCNAVARDNGIAETLKWMEEVLQRNNMLG